MGGVDEREGAYKMAAKILLVEDNEMNRDMLAALVHGS